MPQPNQHKPCPPRNDPKCVNAIKYFYGCRVPDTAMVEYLKEYYDTEIYGLSLKSLKRWRFSLGLLSTRQQKNTTLSISAAVDAIVKEHPERGSKVIRDQLALENNIRVSKSTVSAYLRLRYPELVAARRRRRFVRRRFYAAGVNDIWVQDQHDKWGPRFGLWLHNNLDPFTGFNNWLKVWWTNKNPRLVVKYFLDAVRSTGAIPVTTQSDPGTENYGVANVQTLARQALDPSLTNTLQHRWMAKKKNVKSEANWSVLRRDFSPAFENLFEEGVQRGWYDVDNMLENLIFRWIAIPWIQHKLDNWCTLRNRSKPRFDKNKVTPHGVPEIIRAHPEQFNALDFKAFSEVLIDQLEAEYAPVDNEVFELTPPEFSQRADNIYTALNRPEVTMDNFWYIYNMMKQAFLNGMDDSVRAEVDVHHATMKRVEEETVELLADYNQLRMGDAVIGDGALDNGWEEQDGGDLVAVLTSSDESDDNNGTAANDEK